MNILISENVYQQIEHHVHFSIREIDMVKVKGKSLPVKIYEVFDSDHEELKKMKIKTMPMLAQGINLYRNGNFQEADLIFKECKNLCPEDELLSVYIKRCGTLIRIPPGADWSGISEV